MKNAQEASPFFKEDDPYEGDLQRAPKLNQDTIKNKIPDHGPMPAEHEVAYKQWEEKLIDRARIMRKSAYSYRGFKVGCSMLLYDPRTNQYIPQDGYNFRPEAKLRGEKLCAERQTLWLAQQGIDLYRKYGDTPMLIVAIVVASNKIQPDSSGYRGTTLHPCAECRKMLKESPLIKDYTILTTVNDFSDEEENAHTDGIEEWSETITIGEMFHLHGEE